ncbi:MAG: hypothetical protein HC817_00360 [Saprospiraceae bacterium]|nr:hypothetical protein [Saprospiraceae bacterium]
MMTNDNLLQGIIEDLIHDFLYRFFPADFPNFDLTQPILFLDKELTQIMPESENGHRRIDKLIQLALKTGEKEHILVHSEMQGYRHENYEKREFIYYYRLYDRFSLPIATLAIFTDSDPDYEPNCYKIELMGTKLTYEFPTYKVLKMDPEALAASENLFDVVLLTVYWAIKAKRKEVTEEDLLDLKTDLIRRLLERNIDKTRIRKLLLFIKAYIRFEKEEISLKFERNYEELLKIKGPMGVEEILIMQAEERGISIGEKRGEERGISIGEERGEERGIKKERTQAEKEKFEYRKSVILKMRSEGFSIEKSPI